MIERNNLTIAKNAVLTSLMHDYDKKLDALSGEYNKIRSDVDKDLKKIIQEEEQKM